MSRRPTQITPPQPSILSEAVAGRYAKQLPTRLTRLSEQWVQQIFRDCQTDKDREDAGRRWRIAVGLESGNPEASGGRSTVKRIPATRAEPAVWCKVYQGGYSECQQHEVMVLAALATDAARHGRSPRSFHAQMVQLGRELSTATRSKPTQLSQVSTEDVGPNLLSWGWFFNPVTWVGEHQLAWPLFASPIFLAAMLRRLLLAIEVLFEHQVVHIDLKPENIGMALPFNHKPSASGTLSGTFDLQDLSLKLLDFECSVFHKMPYPAGVRPLDVNEYVSPFARARLSKKESSKSNAWVQAVDWGADLYALGYMLEEWVERSKQFIDAYHQQLRNELGPLACDRHGLTALCKEKLNELDWLLHFSKKLMLQDRSLALADEQDLPARPVDPLAAFRLELANQFPALRDGVGNASIRFAMQVPQAENPLQSVGWKLARTVIAMVEQGPARLMPYRTALVAATVAVALPASAWHWRADLHAAATQTTADWAQQAVATELAPPGSAWTLKPALWLADQLAPGQAAAVVVAEVTALSAELGAKAPDQDSPETRQASHNARSRYLRAITQLAALPDASLAQAETRDAAKQTLLGLYNHSRWLENLNATGPLAAELAEPLAGLGRLFEQQGWPLAALLGVHLGACYTPQAVDTAQQNRWLDGLRQLPAATPGHPIYAAFAQDTASRLAAGQSACLLPDI